MYIKIHLFFLYYACYTIDRHYTIRPCHDDTGFLLYERKFMTKVGPIKNLPTTRRNPRVMLHASTCFKYVELITLACAKD